MEKIDDGAEYVPEVSIVCAWYNRPDYIKNTIDSLLNQDFDSFEIIVANDGSPDPRVKEILDAYDDSRLTVIHKENEGFTKTIKMLVEKARAPYVAIQGAGEESLPGRFLKQYEVLSGSKEYGMVGCCSVGVIKREGSEDVILGNNNQLTGEVTIDKNRARHPFTHGSIMFRKEAYSLVGGYREYFKYAQDYDLFLRMAARYKCYNLADVLYKRNIFSDGVSTRPEKSFEQAMFVRFADACCEIRKEFGIDPIDKYGVFYFALYSLDIKDRMALLRVVLKKTYCGYFEEAKMYMRLVGSGVLEKFGIAFIATMDKCPVIYRCFKALLGLMYSDTVFMKANG